MDILMDMKLGAPGSVQHLTQTPVCTSPAGEEKEDKWNHVAPGWRAFTWCCGELIRWFLMCTGHV